MALAFVLAVGGCGLTPGGESPEAANGSTGASDDSSEAGEAENGRAAGDAGSAGQETGQEGDAQQSADQDRSPGTMAMRRLLARAGQDQGSGTADTSALQTRVAELEDAIQSLEARLGALEPAVRRWTAMEGRLEELVASLRENAAQRRQSMDAPIPAPPPGELAGGDPTQPPQDPALRGRRRGGGGRSGSTSTASATGGDGSSSTGDPDEIDMYGLHLVSYENRDNAGPGWRSLKDRYSEQLSGLERRMATVTLPDGRNFHRLVAGPIEEQGTAQQRCQRLQERGQYCALTEFVGTPG